MGKEKEWEELKQDVMCGFYRDKYMTASAAEAEKGAFKKVLDKMAELERRSLPERVADLLENIDGNKFAELATTQRYKRWSYELVIPGIAKALRTGDLTELQKWVRE